MTNTGVSHDGLAEFLGDRGFVAVPLIVNAVGHFEVDVSVNGRRVRLVLDTGASHSVLDSASAKRLSLDVTPSGKRSGGLGSSKVVTGDTTVSELRIGDVVLRDRLMRTLDMSHVNRALETRGGTPVDGALGGDVMREHEAIIDYARATVYLRPPSPHT